jgi:6-phospho 3-hexuloisomerase
MGFVREDSEWILSRIGAIIKSIKEEQINTMIGTILGTRNNKILLVGSGRSGLVGRSFAIRLMHIGFNVYVTGETIAPAIVPGDLVIAISGSGRTRTVVTQAETAKNIGAKILAVTSYPESPLAKQSDEIVLIKGRTKEDTDVDFIQRQITGEYDAAPMGTLFELSSMVFLDCVIATLMKKLQKTEIDLRMRHANAE